MRRFWKLLPAPQTTSLGASSKSCLTPRVEYTWEASSSLRVSTNPTFALRAERAARPPGAAWSGQYCPLTSEVFSILNLFLWLQLYQGFNAFFPLHTDFHGQLHTDTNCLRDFQVYTLQHIAVDSKKLLSTFYKWEPKTRWRQPA